MTMSPSSLDASQFYTEDSTHMNISRHAMIRALVSFLAVPEGSKMEPSNAVNQQQATATAALPLPTTATCSYHEPPPRVDYSVNPSVFGKILRGELPAIVFDESPNILAFQDRTPKAPVHSLVIPKQFIPTVASLTKKDLPILQEMHETALSLLQRYQPEAFANDDYILCFHLPPFNSVDHLHLHVLAPASNMNWIYRHGKYQAGTFWCADEATVRQRLQQNKKPM